MFYVKAPVICIATVHTSVKLEAGFTNSSGPYEPYIELNNAVAADENIVAVHDEI